jgi:hypothetical protein
MSARVSLWLIAGFLLPVGGWMLRNHHVTGSAAFSSISSYNLLYFRVAGAIAEERGEARDVVARRLWNRDALPFEAATPLPPLETGTVEALRLLAEHPYGTAMSAMRGAVRLLFGPGTAGFVQVFFGNLPQIAGIATPILAGYLLLVYLGVAAGIPSMLAHRPEPLLLVGAIVAYTLLVCSGPEAYSRFRAPLMPLLAVLAGGGLSSLATLGSGAAAPRS